MGKPVVAFVMPHRPEQGRDSEAMARGVVVKAVWDMEKDQPGGALNVFPVLCWSSLLPMTFNLLLTSALDAREEHGATYFTMIHDDIVPDLGWLPTMVDEMERVGADLLSAVVPIKTPQGVTSTAINGPDPWKVRRITMREVYDLPETFTDADVGGELLVNTGLWVMRLDAPWLDATEMDADGSMVLRTSFHQQDRIVRNLDGTYKVETIPEDWDFSRRVRSVGGKLAATRKVGLFHAKPEWTNRQPWGSLRCDTENFPNCVPLGSIEPELALTSY